jgi:hypothetical protein
MYNDAFVLMQYFGYLRRNPDDSPDNNFAGYDFWLNKLNQFSQPGEDMRNDSQAFDRARRAEMVRAFIESSEYRERFFGSATGNQFAPPDDGQLARWRGFVTRSLPLTVLTSFSSASRRDEVGITRFSGAQLILAN